MGKREYVGRRTNLAMLWHGLACLLITVTTAMAIWMYPHSGPDLRSEFLMFLVPGSALGVTFTLFGMCELMAGKNKVW